ncbi:MAG: peptide chain release factor N(5)-glutamine methyltransferase [Thermodesulfobacteriota bacterium]
MRSAYTIGILLQQAARYLLQHRVDGPRLSAELILAHALGISKLDVLLSQDKVLLQDEMLQVWRMTRQRARGRPLAYILGAKEFYGLDFLVSKDVLIPRPETELIIDLAKGIISSAQGFVFADVGTGSGALGISLLSIYPRSQGLLLDISPAALGVARRNASKHQVLSRCQLAVDDLGAALRPGCLDLVLANPPYLSSTDMQTLSREIREFEPELALWGGPQGQEKALGLLQNICPVLKPGGWCLLEAAPKQIANLVQAKDLVWGQGLRMEVHKDLASKDRVLALHKVCSK